MPVDVHAPEVRRYLGAAPHLKHANLRALYRRLAADAMALAAPDGRRLHILDLGAGEGSATLAFLEAGAEVVAIDDDATRLEVLVERAASYPRSLEVRYGDATAMLAESANEFDLVAAVSILHHVPDYEALLEEALAALRPGGVFFSFQDPLLYASLGSLSHWYARSAYLAWRTSQGDLRNGAARYLRRRRSGFSMQLPEDAEEFHAQRGGVDQQALLRVLERHGVPVRLVVYFSTQAPTFHRLGSALGLENTFALIGGPVG
jgi:ubiquinone/menaquinone biosynthesis C-methylase UbiE